MIQRLPHLRWKKDDPERGLSAVVAGPRGSYLHDGGRRFASVCASSRSSSGKWYWVARCDEMRIPLKNTCDQPAASEQAAKDAALAYVKECLAYAQRES